LNHLADEAEQGMHPTVWVPSESDLYSWHRNLPNIHHQQGRRILMRLSRGDHVTATTASRSSSESSTMNVILCPRHRDDQCYHQLGYLRGQTDIPSSATAYKIRYRPCFQSTALIVLSGREYRLFPSKWRDGILVTL